MEEMHQKEESEIKEEDVLITKEVGEGLPQQNELASKEIVQEQINQPTPMGV